MLSTLPGARRAAAFSATLLALGLIAGCESMERGISFRPYTDSTKTYEQKTDETRSYAPGSLTKSRRYIYEEADGAR